VLTFAKQAIWIAKEKTFGVATNATAKKSLFPAQSWIKASSSEFKHFGFF